MKKYLPSTCGKLSNCELFEQMQKDYVEESGKRGCRLVYKRYYFGGDLYLAFFNTGSGGRFLGDSIILFFYGAGKAIEVSAIRIYYYAHVGKWKSFCPTSD